MLPVPGHTASNTLAAARRQACPQCDLLLASIEPKPGHLARCPRCGCVLASSSDSPVTTTLLLCLTGIIIYFPTILSPILSMNFLWMKESGTIVASVTEMLKADYPLVSLAVLLMVVVFPALLLTSLGLVSLAIKLRRVNRSTARLLRFALALEEWTMVDVFLVGILVTIFKMTDSAEIQFGGGFLACLALALTLISISTVCDHRLFWRRLGHRSPDYSPDRLPKVMASSSAMPAPPPLTATEAGLILCPVCHQLQQPGSACKRCGGQLHRRHGGLAGCWAFLITAALLLLPANLLPIMEVESLGQTSSSTIIGGILYFFDEGNYLIGMIIFIASVLVPIIKIVALATLLITAQGWHPVMLREKTALYRFITFIGRWSMLDIFVIALLNAMVQFGILSSVRVAPAATWFCLVVAITMLATHYFDPRLMWDALNRPTHDEYSH